MKTNDTAVLFMVFNRPDTAMKALSGIRKSEPKRLYIAADGPRPEKIGEIELCQRTREIVNQVDWDCEVKTLFREDNLGCARAVSSAITWFFEHEREGIILEDDCIPHPDFFLFAQTLLSRYRNQKNISMICGTNFLQGKVRAEHSYYFSAFSNVWGWASWRDRWNGFSLSYTEEAKQEIQSALRLQMPQKHQTLLMQNWLHEIQRGNLDSWAIPFALYNMCLNRLSIVPIQNLVSNIGFGLDATHTVQSAQGISQLKTDGIKNLVHPDRILQNRKADRLYLDLVLCPPPPLWQRLPEFFYSILPNPIWKLLRILFKRSAP